MSVKLGMAEHVVLKFDSNKDHDVTSEIMVEWTSGKSTGKSSWIKHTDVKEGRIAIGEEVKVIWGKSKQVIRVEKLVGLLPPALELLGSLS